MTQLDCSKIRPLLLAAADGELDGARGRLVAKHLAGCAECRAELVAEQSLSSLLRARPSTRARTLRVGRGALAAGAVIALACIPFFAGGPPAYGSVSASRLALPALAWQEGDEHPLAAMNHIELSARDRVSFRIDGVGSLSAVGPAAFELDGSTDGWKLVLLRGEVSVAIDPGGTLLAVTQHGARTLEAGEHVVDLAPPAAAGAEGTTPGEEIARGIQAFFQLEDMDAAERAFRAAAAHPACTSEQRNQALFYLSASLSRLERYDESLEVSRRWRELYPDDDNYDYASFFEGVHLERLGRVGEARAVWTRLLEDSPDSSLAEHVRASLAALPAAAREGALSGGGAAPEEPAARRPYLVVPVALDPAQPSDAEFLAVAGDAARYHEAELAPFDGSDFGALAARLAETRPDAVLFVLAPETLDVDLHRRILLLAARLDSDAFPDFAFGYFTASDGDALRKLWRRTVERHERGLASKRWESCFVQSSGESLVYDDYIPEAAQAAGFRGRGIGFGTIENDPRVLAFADRELKQLERAAVIDLTGNGDPQGVWLFDDHRNIDDARHWEFAPELVGHDPQGEMPRLLADRWRALELDAPVVWSGTCHSAAVHRVYVEGDIVSTFGRAQAGDVYELEPQESLGLALIDAGAVALLAPIAANHGYTVMCENDFALVNGASLGATIKSTWDDVFLQAEGEIALDLHGEPPRGEQVMQGGGANRVLIGDPALALFDATPHPLERAELLPHEDGSFEVRVTWDAGFHSGAWDLFGTTPAADGRVRARVDVTELVAAGERVRATVEVLDDAGAKLPYRLRHAALESFAGRRYLHLQANAPRRAGADERGITARFRVEIE